MAVNMLYEVRDPMAVDMLYEVIQSLLVMLRDPMAVDMLYEVIQSLLVMLVTPWQSTCCIIIIMYINVHVHFEKRKVISLTSKKMTGLSGV